MLNVTNQISAIKLKPNLPTIVRWFTSSNPACSAIRFSIIDINYLKDLT